jgi:DNA replication protein DnaC
MKPPRILDCPGANCPGFYRASNLPPDHPWFGHPVQCQCALRRQAQQCTRLLPAELHRMTFAAFQAAPHQSRALRLAEQFAADPWQGRSLFTLIGSNRTGKTHLAAAIVNALLERGEPIWFMGVPALLDDLRNGYADNTYHQRLLAVQQAQLLVLDDLGADHTQSGEPYAVAWSHDKLFQIIDHRLLHQLPTIVTTNCLPVMLPPRIGRRLWDERHGTVVALEPAKKA